MNVHTYVTSGGKDKILEYLDNLPINQRTDGYKILSLLEENGLVALNELNTRQLHKKLWEIKFDQERMMYVIADEDNLYVVNACKKEKGKAELYEINKAKRRVKELEKELGKKFI